MIDKMSFVNHLLFFTVKTSDNIAFMASFHFT